MHITSDQEARRSPAVAALAARRGGGGGRGAGGGAPWPRRGAIGAAVHGAGGSVPDPIPEE